MKILIQVLSEDDNVLGQRETRDWGVAEQSLASLRKGFENLPEVDPIEQVEENEELLAQEELDHETQN